MPKRSSRRDFLKGKSAADAIGERMNQAAPDQASDNPSDRTPEAPTSTAAPGEDGACLIRIGREAMACSFEVLLHAGQYEQGTEAALAALDRVEQLEERLSIFRPSSQLSRVNRLAADEPVEVDPELFELLQRAVRLCDATGGAFDITAGPLSDVWGFSRRNARVPTPDELEAALALVGPDKIELDPDRRTVRFTRRGVKLNLGAIGKGHALDRCAEDLRAAGVDDFLIHGGQSSVLARGTWTVGVPHPLNQRQRLAEIRLRDRALGTSGSQRQFFHHQGRRLSHLLDPRTGQPAESGVLAATVLASTAAEADALATAVFVLGVEPALEFRRRRAELGLILGLILVVPSGQNRVDLVTAGLDEDDLDVRT